MNNRLMNQISILFIGFMIFAGTGCQRTSASRVDSKKERVDAKITVSKSPGPDSSIKDSETVRQFPKQLREYYDYLLLAQLYRQQAEQQPDNALDLQQKELTQLRQASQLNLESSYIHALVADRLQKLEQIQEAEEEAKLAVKLDPETDLGYLVLGRIYHQGKKIDDAIEMFETALSLNPEQYDASIQLAQIYQDKGDLMKANEIYGKLAESYPEMAHRFFQLMAQNCLISGELETAIKYYEQVARLLPYPYNLQAYKSMGLAYLHREKFPEAVQMFERIAALDTSGQGKMEAEALLADTYSRMGDYEKAAKSYAKVVHLNPEHWPARRQLGLIFFYLGRYGDAVEQLSEYLKKDANDWMVLEHLGVAYAELGDREQAITLLERLRQEGQAGSQVYIELAELYDQKGQPDQAEQVLQEASEKSEDPVNLLFSLALFQYDHGKYEKAETNLKKTLELDPDHKGSYLYLGLTYDKLNRLDLLEEKMRQVIELDPEFAEAYNLLGYAFADKGIRLKEAEELILKAVELKPDRGFIIDSLGWVYYQQGRYAEAVAELEKAIQLSGNPPDWVVLDHLGDAYSKMNQTENAVKTWNQAIEILKSQKKSFATADQVEDIEKLETKILKNSPPN